MTKFSSAYDFQETFSIEETSALIAGLLPSRHRRGNAPIAARIRSDAAKGLLVLADGVIQRSEISRWLESADLHSEYLFMSNMSGSSEDLASRKELGKRERETLLTIIAVLCKQAGVDFTKAAKSAVSIQSTAHQMGLSLGETTIEKHLKNIPDALTGRMK